MSNILREYFGTFDGENMIGENENIYPVPENYASKSKLVEGDRLKMIVSEGGIFFKLVNMVDRKTFVGKVISDEDSIVVENEDGQVFRLLRATIAYYKLCPGDEVIAVAPRFPFNQDETWCAIEGLITQRKSA